MKRIIIFNKLKLNCKQWKNSWLVNKTEYYSNNRVTKVMKCFTSNWILTIFFFLSFFFVWFLWFYWQFHHCLLLMKLLIFRNQLFVVSFDRFCWFHRHVSLVHVKSCKRISVYYEILEFCYHFECCCRFFLVRQTWSSDDSCNSIYRRYTFWYTSSTASNKSY